jgi:hypothetical protein
LIEGCRVPLGQAAARHRLPAIYAYRYYAQEGGLISYGNIAPDAYRQAATYIDRILRGAKPADLPVQMSVKFELVVNVKTAKAMGLTIRESFLVRADEVIMTKKTVEGRPKTGSLDPRIVPADSLVTRSRARARADASMTTTSDRPTHLAGEQFRSAPRTCRPFCGVHLALGIAQHPRVI